MATGTGKTRTCLGLVYRLLKTNRFRRILFLVDRTTLGEQTENVFRELRLASQNTLAEIFGVKGLKEPDIDPDTRFHVATIQGLLIRLQSAKAPPSDQYDCIIVDECHRGYLLDRQMSETELSFRDEADYISQYTRALDHFDAIKIGLTATPALHTTQLFGKPVFSYGYREAVRDGYLVPHGPPIRIETNLSTQGIQWSAGDDVPVLQNGQIDLVHLTDELAFDIDSFNKNVITRPFNEAVCAELAQHIDPSLPGKTILFCATDQHADLVVNVLREALQKHYGEVENDAVLKITGQTDNHNAAIRRFRNERNPTFAVTVDLLSTGVDVPSVTNIVFLRRVRSRILYEQMLGRATRLCPEIEKDSFQIFDAVRLYEALNGFTEMNLSHNVSLSTEQLVAELRNLPAENTDGRNLVAEQLLSRLTRRFSLLAENEAVCLRATGKTSAELQRELQNLSPEEIADYLAAHPVLLRLLDRMPSTPEPQFISEHPDAVRSVSRDYHGKNAPDYLSEFAAFLEEKNQVPALLAVKTKPHDLTRAELRSLHEMLDEKGFTEQHLQSAQREAKNEDIAASIVGFIRAYALGDPLKPYAERVDSALQRLLQQHPSLSDVQRRWLRNIAAGIKSGTVVEFSDLDTGEFKKQAGGLQRLDKLFEGRLQSRFQELRALIWS
jgi:type I restriction enzyme R subunit